MSSLRRDLIEKRLWPLVVILILAIVAIPFVIARRSQASTTYIPPVPTVGTGTAKPVAGSSSGSSVSISVERKELHRLTESEIKREAERNPFTVAPSHTPAATGTGSSASSTSSATTPTGTDTSSTSPSTTAATSAPTSIGAGTTVTSGGTSAGSSGAEAPASTMTTTATVTETTTAPALTTTTTTAQSPDEPIGDGPWTMYSVDVRTATFNFSTHKFGPVTTQHDLARLTPLPSIASPKVMFTGVTDHGHEAVFALGDGVKATGAARCLPDASVCSAIALSAGAVESLTWYDADGSVDERTLAVGRLVGTVTNNRARAAAAFARHSQAGQCELDLANPLQYDATSGSARSASSSDCAKIKDAVPFPGDRSGS